MALPAPAIAVLDALTAQPAQGALLLDFDGTLAPIVPHPEDARLIDGAAEVVARLRERLGLVAFISGRGLADLEGRVDIVGLAYAGNHGMELHHLGQAASVADGARAWMPVIAEFAATAADGADATGLWVENKGATLSVHWRRAPDPDAAERTARDVLAPRARLCGLRVTWGRMVMEVRPPVDLNKGTATRELLLRAGTRRAVYIGDDRTDADAWRELHAMTREGLLESGAGIAAVTGDDAEVPSEVLDAADARVPGPAGALDALRYLAGRLTTPA